MGRATPRSDRARVDVLKGRRQRTLISIQVNAGAALERFRRLGNEAKDRRTPNRQLAVQLEGWTLRNFRGGGSMQSPAWSPLKASTAKWKARKGYSSKPLERTGHLRQSFRPFYTNETAGVGSEVPYSKYHETGTRTLPRRSMLPSQDVAVGYAVTIFERWAANLAR